MTSRELCLDRRKRERKAFVNVLKAVPQARMDYKPDPKSRTAGELAWLIAFEDAALVPLIENGRSESRNWLTGVWRPVSMGTSGTRCSD